MFPMHQLYSIVKNEFKKGNFTCECVIFSKSEEANNLTVFNVVVV